MRNYSEQATHAHHTDAARHDANPVGVIGLDVVLTSIALLFLLDTSLPLLASLGAAWIGGAVATIGLLTVFVVCEHITQRAGHGA
ncbi:hypothetical protein G5B39_05385 [Rhodobacteraceae bacterium SC52]|nr:hypothetical protein G5B39_05385 [Rhodobacteraceae bacterium SC52]